jgi:hypothetical protein
MGICSPAIIWYANELISKTNTTIVVPAWLIDAPGHDQTVRAFARTVRPLRGSSGFPCRIVRSCTRTTTSHPDYNEHNQTVQHCVGPSDHLDRTVRICIRRTYCCTLCTNLLCTTAAVHSPTTYLNHNDHMITD